MEFAVRCLCKEESYIWVEIGVFAYATAVIEGERQNGRSVSWDPGSEDGDQYCI